MRGRFGLNLFIIAEILGNLAYSVAFVLCLPLFYACWQSEADAAAAFFFAAMISLLTGGALKQKGKGGADEDIAVREGVAITGVGWFMVSILSFLPYFLGGFLSPLDSLAEAISGLSGTGAAFIADLDPLPRSLLLWRSLTNWIGGIGIIVIFMALLPQFGRGAMYLLRAETTGPMVERQRPRIRDNAIALFSIYIVYTVLCMLGYRLFGMNWYDAVNHAFTTIATGGFSPHNESFIYFDSPLLEAWACFWMLLSSGSFGMYVLAVHAGWRIVWRNTELRAFLALFAIATVLIVIDLMTEQNFSFWSALRYAAFHTASLGSTTGFVAYDFDTWPAFSKSVLLLLMFMGGCAGSTAGGFKILRFVVMVRLIKALIWQKLHPQMVAHVSMNGVRLPPQILFNIARHFFVYVMLDVLFAFFLIFDGIRMIDAVSVSISTMASVGPGFGIAGATSTYAILPPFSKAVACVSMFFGRLEIFTVLAILTPEFWHKGKSW